MLSQPLLTIPPHCTPRTPVPGLQRGRQRGDLPALIHRLGLEQAVLNQAWVELSVRCG